MAAPRAGGHKVGPPAARPRRYFLLGGIHNALAGSVGVDGGHHGLFHPNAAAHHFYHRGNAVGGTAGGRNNIGMGL